MKRIALLLFFFYAGSAVVFSQERLGVITDNYLPVNQLSNNPSAIVDQKPWLSINLLGAHFFARTNFLFLEDTRIKFFKEEPILGFENPSRNGKGFMHAEILGPSATMSYREHGFGFHMAVRTYANINKIPAVLGQIVADQGIDNIEDGVYEMNNGRVKQMSWGEVGFSYGRIIYKRDRVLINGAVTINRLTGIFQTNLIIDNAIVEVENGKGTLRNIDGKYSYSEGNWGAGKGWGLNTGVTYKKMLPKYNVDDYYAHSRKSNCSKPKYLYKIGVSLLDFGYIRFKEDARTATLNDTASVNDLENGVGSVLGIEKTKFTGILPTALSIQFDYRVKEMIYLNSTLVQKISFSNLFGVERSNVFSFSPRFERSWFSASLPLSMANYITPQLGLYFRVGPLAIGTDHLSPFIFKRDQKAGDLYFYLNIPIKKSPECRDEKARENGKWLCPVW
jgi:hypothetical protein